MIYLCQNCGWRINQRLSNKNTPENIGKHFLYNHQPFCSEMCIEEAKLNPYRLIRNVKPSDWDEQGWTNHECPNSIENWKMKRKTNKRKIKNKI
jgi:hypothetical protein